MAALSRQQPPSSTPVSSFLSLAPSSLQQRPFHSYQSFTKIALQHRQYRIYTLSFIALHFSFCFSLLDFSVASLFNVFRPTVLLTSAVAFVLAVLPLLVQRKWCISHRSSAPRITTPAPSRVAHAGQIFSDGYTWSSVMTHAASGAILAACYACALVALSGGKADWGPRRWVAGRDAYYMNERLLFLVLCNALLGAGYALAALAWPVRGIPRFSPSCVEGNSSALGARITAGLRRRAPRAAGTAALGALALLVTYVCARRTLWRFIVQLVGRGSVRRIVVPSFRVPFFSLSLLTRSAVLAAASSSAWEAAHLLFEVYATQPVALSVFAREPARCLAGGLAMDDAYFRHFAFAELALIAGHDAASRKQIYSDVRPAPTPLSVSLSASTAAPATSPTVPTAWQAISRECLRVLDEERKHVLRRGASPVTAAAAPAAKPARASGTTTTSKPGTPTKNAVVTGKNVMLPPKKTIWDALASGDAVAGAPAAAPAISTQVADASGASKLGQLLHRFVPPQSAPAPAASDHKITAPTTPSSPTPRSTAAPARNGDLLDLALQTTKSIWTLLPSDLQHVLSPPVVREYLLTPRVTALVSSIAARDPALSTWATESLGGLVSNSLAEDDYGSVQRDIPLVLEALVRYLNALETYYKELKAEANRRDASRLAATPPGAGADAKSTTSTASPAARVESHTGPSEMELERAWDEQVRPIGNALRTAVGMINHTFGDFPEARRVGTDVRQMMERCFEGSQVSES